MNWFADWVLGPLFLIWEVVAAVGTPIILVAGLVFWAIVAVKGEVRRQAWIGLAVNGVLALVWTALFAPVFVDQIAWPSWLESLAPLRGAAFFLTMPVAVIVDILLYRSFVSAVGASTDGSGGARSDVA